MEGDFYSVYVAYSLIICTNENILNFYLGYNQGFTYTENTIEHGVLNIVLNKNIFKFSFRVF